MNQKREQEALLATQREQELSEQEQAAQEKEEPPQNSDFPQLIGEVCGVKVCKEQKQNMEDTMLELLKDCRQKELYCMHNDVDDLIESALNSKLLLINLKSQHLDKEKQEVKNIVEQPTKCRTRITESLQNFRVIHKMSSISNMSQISSIDPHDVNVESDLIESLLNRDTFIDSSPKLDFLLKEFSEELNAEIADTIVESLSPSPIPIEDGDSQMEEIDLFLDTDDLMPSGIESDNYDSEGDINFLEELLSNDTLTLLETESFHFDYHDDPSFPRPPPEPPNVEIFFDFNPDTGVLIVKVVEDISEHYVLMSKFLPTQPALCPNIDPLLQFSSENEDKVFKPDLEASRACCFVHRPLELQSLAYGNPIS
nr:hypothetical protein [Tanacetum cinerariifolium]